MPRPVTLFTGQWADLPLEDMAARRATSATTASSWPAGATTSKSTRRWPTPATATAKRDLLERYDLQCHAISTHLVGQAVCDPIDERHQVDPAAARLGRRQPGRRQPARRRGDEEHGPGAAQLRRGVVNGFTGSSIWHLLYSFPPTPETMIDAGYEHFAERWNPILDVFGECGVRFALEVHPTEIAFDIYTAERALEAIGNREEFGFNFDPSHLIWQGVDRSSSSRVPRPHLPRPHQGRDRHAQRPHAASWPAISTSATRAAAGTSARRAAAA